MPQDPPAVTTSACGRYSRNHPVRWLKKKKERGSTMPTNNGRSRLFQVPTHCEDDSVSVMIADEDQVGSARQPSADFSTA